MYRGLVKKGVVSNRFCVRLGLSAAEMRSFTSWVPTADYLSSFRLQVIDRQRAIISKACVSERARLAPVWWGLRRNIWAHLLSLFTGVLVQGSCRRFDGSYRSRISSAHRSLLRVALLVWCDTVGVSYAGKNGGVGEADGGTLFLLGSFWILWASAQDAQRLEMIDNVFTRGISGCNRDKLYSLLLVPSNQNEADYEVPICS